MSVAMDPPSCDTSTKAQTSEINIKSGIENEGGSEWFSCHFPQCKFIGRTHAGLNRHVKTHSLGRPYACSQCDRRCISLQHLKEHQKIHSDIKPFWCLLCEYKCRSKANLKTHLITHSNERPHACHSCDFRSKTLVNLKNHLRRHTGEKPYRCCACAYRCSTQGSLNVHMRTHTGERPYVCSVCQYRSATSGALKSHYKVHSQDSPFKCDECPRSFSGIGQLKVHKNVHSKDKTFRCSKCAFESNVVAEIHQHILIHADDSNMAGGNCTEVTFRRVSSSSKESSALNSLGRTATSHHEAPNNQPSRSPELSQSPSDINSVSFRQTRSDFYTHTSSNPKHCIFCQSIFMDIECLKDHVLSHLREHRPRKVPEFKLPLAFFDKLFPPNHLHEKYWNETGVPARLDGFFSIFLQGFVDGSLP